MNKYNNHYGVQKVKEQLIEPVNKISISNKRKLSRIPVTYSITIGGIVIVENVISGSRLVNNGTTIIRYNVINERGSKEGSPAIVIEPGNSVEIPRDYNIISVENSSIKTEGTFYLRVK